jgi:signal transduction histidine kinase
MEKLLHSLTYFFKPRSIFLEKEWILKYQIQAKLIFSFFFGIGIFFFSIARFLEQNYIVSIAQFIFSMILLYAFFRLRRDKTFYKIYSLIFFIIFLLYTGIIFFHVPENTLNILWIIFTPVLIFFFLNKRAGIVMFLLIFSFILYLIISGYDYNVAEFITLLATFFVTSFMMYMYERMKESESQRLKSYNATLEEEVQKQTQELAILNEHLEERVQEELEKRLMQEKMLLCQNRMANMGMMIDSIAHQWRQPLMSINAKLMNISRITESEVNNVKYIDEKVENIFGITEQMAQTIHDFRNLFKSEKEYDKFDVTQLINNLLTFMDENLYTININMKTNTPLYVHSYQNELSQVLLTIFQNSVEALDEKDIKNKEISIHVYELSSNVYIEITDNAKGIKEEILEKIFDPYFSTKKKTTGTGLGLYIAKIIMDTSLEGKINVSNTKKGVKFQLVIPKVLELS